MKQLLILSDSHGCYPMVKKAVQTEPQVDGIVFLGDGAKDMERLKNEGFSLPIYAVRGNCDMMTDYPVERMEQFGGQTVLLCHGHRYGVKYNYSDFVQAVKEKGANIGLFGHTHLPTLEQYGTVTLFNPGSIGSPRFGAPSYGLLYLNEDGTVQFEHKEITAW